MTSPRFQYVASGRGFLSDSEISQVVADFGPRVEDGRLGTGRGNVEVRRSQVVGIAKRAGARWLYQRVWEAAQEFNRQFFGVELSGIEGNLQLARYDSTDSGFYDWHPDFSEFAPERKLSISVQLSDPQDYEGGDLELSFSGQPYRADRTKGMFIVFPSFVLHRVAPVTRGTRWSLVAWISGPRWR
jgi:predicted 2-oxoglutarate/Fe(II)-dependent dioxygenase YbiX